MFSTIRLIKSITILLSSTIFIGIKLFATKAREETFLNKSYQNCSHLSLYLLNNPRVKSTLL